jgi:hypothetical protein
VARSQDAEKPLATATATRAGNDVVVVLDNPEAW